METKISKAQQEVWEWKEKAYQEIKHLSTREQMYLSMNKQKNLLTVSGKKSKTFSEIKIC